MNQQTVWFKSFMVFVLSALLAGCGGGTASSRAPSTTDLLLQSGFQAEPVKSPAHLQKLPANQFVTVPQQGKTTYVYTDPTTNQLYFGSETAYQRYKAKAAETGATEAQQSFQQGLTPAEWKMYYLLYGGGQ